MMKYFAIIMPVVFAFALCSCGKTHNIYLLTYHDPKIISQPGLKLERMRDTQFVNIRYNGDFGRTENVYYNLKGALPDGNYRVYINHILKERETYKNGRKNGDGIKYYDDGSYSTFICENDTIAGVALQHYASGVIKKRLVFSSGKLILVSHYSEQAKIISHTFYINEMTVRTEKFDDSNDKVIITDQNEAQNATLSAHAKFSGQKLYTYSKGNFIVTYSNNDIVDCQWMPVSANR